MEHRTELIKTYENFRGYRGSKRVGYVSDLTQPDKTRITNFLMKNKVIREDKRIQFTLINGINSSTVDVVFPKNFFDESFTRFQFENFTTYYGSFFFYGRKEDFINLKKHLKNAL